MPIEEIIEELEDSKDYPASDPASNEALNGAINIMRKYQKMQRVFDEIRAEIGKSKTNHEWQIAERDIKARLLISDIYCDMVNILDKYKTESEGI